MSVNTAKFCFVIHPLSLEDVARYEPSAKGKGAPIIRKIMEWMPAWNVAHVTGVRTHLFDQLSPQQVQNMRDIGETLLRHLDPDA